MVGRLLALPNAVQLLGSLILFVAGIMVITTEMGAWSGGGGTQSPILLERVHLLKVKSAFLESGGRWARVYTTRIALSC